MQWLIAADRNKIGMILMRIGGDPRGIKIDLDGIELMADG
jgi:hypothetical protein